MLHRFEWGDDLGLFLRTNFKGAHAWRVVVHRPDEPPQVASALAEGAWLSPYRRVEAGEVIWDVGLQSMEPKGTTIEISRPDGRTEHIPHPGASSRSRDDRTLDNLLEGLID